MNAPKEKRDLAYWLIGLLYTLLGTCDRLRTSTVIVKDGLLRGFGTNDSTSDTPSCDSSGEHLLIENHCLRTNHGEETAIIDTDRQYLCGGEAQIVATPCLNCVKKLLEAGVQKIDYVGSYANALGKDYIADICARKGVPLTAHNFDWAEMFQQAFDLLGQPGGAFYREGYRLKVVKEELKK